VARVEPRADLLPARVARPDEPELAPAVGALTLRRRPPVRVDL